MKFFLHSIILLILVTLFSLSLAAQNNIHTAEKTEISGGAEFDQMLQDAMKSGNIDLFKSNKLGPPIAAGTEGASFLGFNFDDNATENGVLTIPPDPIAAAGVDRIVAVVNRMIECRNKSGTLIFRDALRDFFSPLAPQTGTFDPKVIYDQYENRFVVVTLERINGGTNPNVGNISLILVAVSKTSSPATATSADWYYHSINSKVTLTGPVEVWADYPGFAVDEEAVYITNNMFEFPGGPGSTLSTVRLWIINKGVVGGFYSGGAASVSIFNPYASAGLAATTQPAHVFGVGGVGSGANGTFLVSYSGLTNTVQEFVQVVRVDNPLGIPTFTQQFINIGDIENFAAGALPDAPQLGPPAVIPIEVNDRRALHAVWRSNSLFMTTTIDPSSGPDAGQTTARWIELNTSNLAAITVADQGNIGGEDIATDTYTFFPSIAVNGNKDMVVCFSASAASIYPGAYYTGRRLGDPAGTVGPSQTMQAGLDYYIRTFGGSRNRWGDYSGASVDPSDDQTFWAFNEYAEVRGTPTNPGPEDGRWGTVYTSIAPGDPLPVELISFRANLSKNVINLDWTTATEIDNFGFDIERKINSTANWRKVGFVAGNGNSNSENLYSFADKDIVGGTEFQYRLKQINNDGSFEYSNVINVELVPHKMELSQNYPNPFNPSTNIQFTLARDSNVKINVINVLGEFVKVAVKDKLPAGIHKTEFNGEDIPSGIYFYTLEIEGKVEDTKKMLLIK